MRLALSSERQRHGHFPTSLCLQDELHYLARRAAPRMPASREVTDCLQFWCAVGHAHGQSGSPRQRNVRQIVTHVGYLFFRHASLSHALLEGLGFLCLSQVYKSYL